MLRDGAPGLEVFLLRRHGASDVLGGAHVFPGGKVDPQDALLDMAMHLDETPQVLHAGLAEAQLDTQAACGLYVAALREAFEETGVLYAAGAGPQEAAHAAALTGQGLAFNAVLAAMGLRLQASSLVPWCRWITPRVGMMVRKRFDTRFFVAGVPAGQQATHDNHEATESIWLAPRAALQLYWDGAMQLAPPQIMGLAHLSRHASVESVLAQARKRLPPLIEPEPFEQDGVRTVCYPGDERHPVRERALPGPTRLYLRNGRLEPAGGLDALVG